MLEQDDPKARKLVGLRLRPESVSRVDRIAAQTHTSRSAVLRLAFIRGLDAAERELRGRE